MRLISILAPALVLAGCGAQPAPQPPGPVAAAPFVVPMDPGAIRCAELSNPAALSEATQWVLGQARAAALSGSLTSVPDSGSVASQIAGYCAGSPGGSLRDAAAALGV